MIREIHTIEEATREWVREMNAIPYELISKIAQMDIDSLHEITTPSKGDRVYVYDLLETNIDGTEYETDDDYGEIIGLKTKKESVKCQNVDFGFMKAMILVTFLALMVQDIIFIVSIGFLCIR